MIGPKKPGPSPSEAALTTLGGRATLLPAELSIAATHPVTRGESLISVSAFTSALRSPLVVAALLAAVVAASPPSALAAEPAPAPAAAAPTKQLTDKQKQAAREDADARERLLSSIRTIQQRPFLHAIRFELQILGGVGVNDVTFRNATLSGYGRLHITEEVSVAVGYTHFFVSESPLYDTLIGDFELFPERSLTRFYGGLDVSYAPIYGKFAAFDSAIVHFDLYLLAGGGVTQTSRSSDLKPAGMVGVGWRLIAARWLSFNIELRDHIFSEDFNAGSEIVNNVVVQAGISFFLPFDHDYSFPR
jgi:outer membrane beta-barrel protein